MDSLDPMFAKIADVWMETLIEDFGTDHWYQLDGYFNGGTAPWLADKSAVVETDGNPSITGLDGMRVAVPGNVGTVPIDKLAYKRGANAYMSLNRTDPNAIWSFQGWAFINWNTVENFTA